MRHLALAVALLVTAGMPARAEDGWQPPPERLTIGYDGEGKVDISPQSCDAFARKDAQWSEDEIFEGAREVCAARKRHLLAYEALQKSYTELRNEIVADRYHGIETGPTIKSFEAMIKNCIDHKFGMSNGGHNIRADIIPNDDAAACLTIGKQLLDAEIVYFKVGFTTSHPAP
jgi:hypothetical protein